MSLPNIQVNVVVNLKGNEKIKELNSLIDTLITRQRALTKSARAVTASLKTNTTAYGTNAKAVKTNQRAHTDLNRTYGAGRRSMAAYGKEVRTQSRTLETMAKKVMAVRKGFTQSIAVLQRMQRAYQQTGDTIKKGFFRRLSEAELQYDALFRSSFRLQMAGQMLIDWAMSAAGAIKNLTDAWADYEFMLNRASGALQLFKKDGSEAAALYEQLNVAVLDLSQTLGLFPAEEVAKATYFWASTTGQTITKVQDIERLMGAVNPLMKIAAMTQTEYETAIKGTYSILVQYGKSIADVEDVTSKLFIATQKTALEFPDLINSFKMVGPLAATMGVTFEDVAQTLGQLGDAGIRGTMAGRALRQTFIKLVRPTQIARKTLDEVFAKAYGKNMTFSEVAFPEGQFIGLHEYIQKLAFALKDYTQEQKQAVLATVTTANELPVMTALVDNQIKKLSDASKGWDDAKTALGGYGSAVEIFEKSWGILANSWKGLTAQLERGIEVLRIQIGRIIAEALTPAVEKAKEIVKAIQNWVKANPELVENITKLAGLAAAISFLAGAMLVATAVAARLWAAFMSMLKAAGPVAAQWALLAGLATMFIDALKRNWDYITRVVTPSLLRLKEALFGASGAGSDLKDGFRDLIASMRRAFDWIVRRIADLVAGFADFVAAIAEIAPVKEVIMSIGRAMLVAFALIHIARMFKITAAAMAMKNIFVALIPVIRMTTTATISMTGAMRALGKAGPMLIVTGLMLVAELLASVASAANIHIPIISDLFGDVGDSASDAANRVKDFYDSLTGETRDTLELTLKMADQRQVTNDIEAFMATVDREWAKQGRSREKLTRQGFIDRGLAAIQQEALARQSAWVDDMAGLAGYYGKSYDEVTERVIEFNRQWGLSMDDSVALADKFYKHTEGGANLVPDAIKKMWQDSREITEKYGLSADDLKERILSPEVLAQAAAEASVSSAISKAQNFVAQGKWKDALEILDPMTNDIGQYGLDIEKRFNQVLSHIPESIRQPVRDAIDVAGKAPSEIFQAFLDGLNNLGSLEEQWKELKKNKNLKKTPMQIAKEAISSLTDPNSPINKALNSKYPALQEWGAAKAEEVGSLLTTNLGDWKGNPKDYEKVKNKLKNLLLPDTRSGKLFADNDPAVFGVVSGVYESFWGAIQNAPTPEAKNTATGNPILDRLYEGTSANWGTLNTSVQQLATTNAPGTMNAISMGLQAAEGAAAGGTGQITSPLLKNLISGVASQWPAFDQMLKNAFSAHVDKPLTDFFGPGVEVTGSKIEIKAGATKHVIVDVNIKGGTAANTNAGAVRSALNDSNFGSSVEQAAARGWT